MFVVFVVSFNRTALFYRWAKTNVVYPRMVVILVNSSMLLAADVNANDEDNECSRQRYTLDGSFARVRTIIICVECLKRNLQTTRLQILF